MANFGVHYSRDTLVYLHRDSWRALTMLFFFLFKLYLFKFLKRVLKNKSRSVNQKKTTSFDFGSHTLSIKKPYTQFNNNKKKKRAPICSTNSLARIQENYGYTKLLYPQHNYTLHHICHAGHARVNSIFLLGILFQWIKNVLCMPV